MAGVGVLDGHDRRRGLLLMATWICGSRTADEHLASVRDRPANGLLIRAAFRRFRRARKAIRVCSFSAIDDLAKTPQYGPRRTQASGTCFALPTTSASAREIDPIPGAARRLPHALRARRSDRRRAGRSDEHRRAVRRAPATAPAVGLVATVAVATILHSRLACSHLACVPRRNVLHLESKSATIIGSLVYTISGSGLRDSAVPLCGIVARRFARSSNPAWRVPAPPPLCHCFPTPHPRMASGHDEPRTGYILEPPGFGSTTASHTLTTPCSVRSSTARRSRFVPSWRGYLAGLFYRAQSRSPPKKLTGPGHQRLVAVWFAAYVSGA